MKRFNSLYLLMLLTTLYSVVYSEETPEHKIKARACLKSYGKLALHNFKHIKAQKLLLGIITNRQKIENYSPEDEEYKELLK